MVEKIQADELAIARYLIREHGVSAIYSEGVSEKAMRAYRLRISIMRDWAGDRPRELLLELGIPGQLLLSGEVKDVRPLEDEDSLVAAGPAIDDDGNLHIDPEKVQARRKAMVANLPTEGLALIVLGGSHDLGPHLKQDVFYIAVTPRSYPE